MSFDYEAALEYAFNYENQKRYPGEQKQLGRRAKHGSRSRPCIRPKIAMDDKHKERAARSAYNRAIKSSAVRVELVDVIGVLERDKYRCQICHLQTFPSLRGTSHDLAPEVDHIKPLSKGGNHTWTNCQCTCRRCNQLKSDKVIGEMGDGLVGQLPEDEWHDEIARIEERLWMDDHTTP